MTPSQLLDPSVLEAALDGLAVGLGIALFIMALVGFVKREPDPESFGASFARTLRGSTQRLAISGLVGILVALLTGWPVAGIAVCALIFFWGKLFGGVASERLAMQRVEALAMWTESLRDTIAGAVGLEQAIPASARAASPVLRPHLNTLIDRVRARMPLPDALQYLADDIDDASADLVISALMLNAKLRGPGLRDVLGSLAKSAREEVDMRQRVMAQRAGTRRSVQIIVIVVCVVVLGVAFLAGSFVKPYDTLAGQMVLCMVIALFGAGFWWMRRLAEVEPPPRLLVRRSPGEQRAAEGMAPGPQTMSPWSMPPTRAAPFPSAAASTASSTGSSTASSPVPPNGSSLRPTSNSLFTPTRTTSGSLFTPSPLSTPMAAPPLPSTPLSTPPVSTPSASSPTSSTPSSSTTPPASPLSTSSMSASQSSTPPQPRRPFAVPPQPRPPEPMPPHPLPPQQMPAQQSRSSSLLPQWKSPASTPPSATPPSSTPALSPPTSTPPVPTASLPTPPVPAPQVFDPPVLDPTVPLPRIRLPLASGPSASTSLAPPRSTATPPTTSTPASTQTDPLETSQPSAQRQSTQQPATQEPSTPDPSDEPPSTPPGDTP